jgi:hypothetical protein
VVIVISVSYSQVLEFKMMCKPTILGDVYVVLLSSSRKVTGLSFLFCHESFVQCISECVIRGHLVPRHFATNSVGIASSKKKKKEICLVSSVINRSLIFSRTVSIGVIVCVLCHVAYCLAALVL